MTPPVMSAFGIKSFPVVLGFAVLFAVGYPRIGATQGPDEPRRQTSTPISSEDEAALVVRQAQELGLDVVDLKIPMLQDL